MNRDDIDDEVRIAEPVADIDEDCGYRPVLLEGFTPIDGSDVIVPVDSSNPASYTLALTHEQAAQALVALASQIGKAECLLMIEELA